MRKLLVFALYFVRLSLLGPHPGSRLTVEPMIISRLPHAAAQRHRCIIEQDTKSAQQNQFSSPSFLLHTWKNRIKKLCLSLHPPPRNQKQQQQLGGVTADTNKTDVGIFPTSSCRFHNNNNKRKPTTITTNTQITSLLVLLHEAANCSLFSTTHDHNLPSTTTTTTNKQKFLTATRPTRKQMQRNELRF